MSDTAIAVKEKFDVEYPYEGQVVKLNPSIVKKYLVHGKADLVTDSEVIMFMQICRYQGINPFIREAYLIKFSSSEPASIVTSKDWHTKKAASIKECKGYKAGIIIRRKTGKGSETEIIRRIGAFLLDGEELVGGWSTVFREGWQEAVEVEVSLKEYLRYNQQGEVTRPWRTMPATLIRKVALVQGLREAFPNRYQQLYAPEEMGVDESQLPQEPIKMPEAERVVERRVTPEPQPPQGQPEKPTNGGTKTEAKPAGAGAGKPAAGPDSKDPGLNKAFDQAGKKPEPEKKNGGGLPTADTPGELDIF